MKRTLNLLTCVGFVFLLISSVVFPLLPDSVAAASVTETPGTFVDKVNVKVDNIKTSSNGSSATVIFKDTNPFDNATKYEYKFGGCTDSFDINGNDFNQGHSSGSGRLVAILHIQYNFNSGCQQQPDQKIVLGNVGVRWISAYIIDSNTVFMPETLNYHHGGLTNHFGNGDYGEHVFKKNQPGDTQYLLLNSDGTLNKFSDGGERVRDVSGNGATYDIQDCSDVGIGPFSHKVCNQYESHHVTLANNGKPSTPDSSVYPSAPKAANNCDPKDPTCKPSCASGDTTCEANATNGGSCESHGGALSWVLCPVIELLDNGITLLDNAIQAQLHTPDPTKTTCDSSTGVIVCTNPKSNPLKDTWGRLRNIALIILVPIMLVMVIGTAIGVQGLDAYTVKRAMPRLLISVIFISLSWYITSFMINLTNVVGAGTLGIMTQPFGIANKTLGSFISVGSGATISIATPFLVAGAVLALADLGIIITLFLVAALALFLGFVILVLRQVLIYIYLLLAPLAILAWIFPNTNRLWKMWWGSFTKLLIMYPLIVALIAAGRIGAAVIPQQQGGGGFWTDCLILVAYIAPYFFIPMTFKFAGGAFSMLSGFIQDRGRGIRARQLKSAGERSKALRERAGRNLRFNPNGRLGRLNSLAGAVADPVNYARIKSGSERGKAIAVELAQKGSQQSQELSKWFSQAGFNQEALSAVMRIAAANGGRVTQHALDSEISALRTRGGTQNLAAAEQLQNSGSFLADTWRTEEFGRAHVGMAAGLSKAQQGFVNSEDESELAEYSNILNGKGGTIRWKTGRKDSDGNDIYDSMSVAAGQGGGRAGLGDTFKTTGGLLNAQAGGLTKVGYSEQVDQATGRYIAGGTAARSIQLSRSGVRELSSAKASQIKKHFIDNGVMASVLGAADGTTLTDDTTGEKITVDATLKKSIIDNITQAAYGFDTPAETAALLRDQLGVLSQDPSLAGIVAESGSRINRGGAARYDALGGDQPPPPTNWGGSPE